MVGTTEVRALGESRRRFSAFRQHGRRTPSTGIEEARRRLGICWHGGQYPGSELEGADPESVATRPKDR